MSRRTVVALLAASLAFAGCGIPDRIVGLHDVPPERSTGAPLDPAGARLVATTTLQKGWAALTAPKAKAATLQAKALTGSALLMAQAAAATGTKTVDVPLETLSTPTEAKLVGISTGKAFPRAILAADLTPTTNTQYLHVLVSTSASAPYQVAASVPMFGGTTLPSLGDLVAGTPFAQSTPKDKPEPHVAAYAAALAKPKGRPSPLVTTSDELAKALAASSALQVRTLGKLGRFAEAHQVLPGQTYTWTLPDGGTVVFALLERVDTITLTPTAKELVLPSGYARLAKRAKATKNVVVRSLESVVLVVPASGPAQVIGADEQLRSVVAK